MSARDTLARTLEGYKSFVHDTWFDPAIPVLGRVVATSVVAFTMLVVFVVIGCILTSPIGFLAVSFAIFLAYFLARHIARTSDKQARPIEPSKDDGPDV